MATHVRMVEHATREVVNFFAFAMALLGDFAKIPKHQIIIIIMNQVLANANLPIKISHLTMKMIPWSFWKPLKILISRTRNKIESASTLQLPEPVLLVLLEQLGSEHLFIRSRCMLLHFQ